MCDRDTKAPNSLSPRVSHILDEFRLEEIASHLLRRAHFHAEEMFAREFADEAITPRQKAALISVYQYPGQNQKTLAERLFMDHNTVADMVSRLVASGLLDRKTAKDDKRAYELFLAPAGLQMLDRVMARDLKVERRLLEKLPEEYRPLFLKCLRLIINSDAQEGKPSD
jgi:DNA-binding MarR family transcriptional regulator